MESHVHDTIHRYTEQGAPTPMVLSIALVRHQWPPLYANSYQQQGTNTIGQLLAYCYIEYSNKIADRCVISSNPLTCGARAYGQSWGFSMHNTILTCRTPEHVRRMNPVTSNER